jgi:hypothetical protein
MIMADRPNYISIPEAAMRLKDAPSSTILQQRNELRRHMLFLKRATPIVSLAEYRKYAEGCRILDGVLKERRGRGE